MSGSGLPADTTTGGKNGQYLRPRPTDHVNKGIYSYLGDKHDWYWDDVPDEDWHGIQGVGENYEYTITVETEECQTPRS